MADDEDASFSIEMRRCIDGLIYRFEPDGLHNGRRCWRRSDRELALHWSNRSGWVIGDADGLVLGRPWDVEIGDQGALPPEGVWVSRKGPTSYVYHLTRL